MSFLKILKYKKLEKQKQKMFWQRDQECKQTKWGNKVFFGLLGDQTIKRKKIYVAYILVVVTHLKRRGGGNKKKKTWTNKN